MCRNALKAYTNDSGVMIKGIHQGKHIKKRGEFILTMKIKEKLSRYYECEEGCGYTSDNCIDVEEWFYCPVCGKKL